MMMCVMENEEAVLLRQLLRNPMEKVGFHEISYAGSVYFFYI